MVNTWIGDFGNSGLKVSRFREGRPGPVKRFYGAGALKDAAAWLKKNKCTQLHAGCANTEREQQLKNALRANGLTCRPIKKSRSTGMVFLYDFKKMGIDRLADAVAARADYPERNLIVLDFGTALTINVIEENCFSGGFVTPGHQTLLDTLVRRAPALPSINVRARKPTLARTTRDAVATGSQLLFLYGVAGILAWLKNSRKKTYRIIATGGGAGLAGLLPGSATRDDSLTLRGLHKLVKIKKPLITERPLK
jgi:pantothenate kinase type III